jgi:NAD(P)-dependent dehydrogenase (short-subunit alcohol dehydrogenase family)
MGSMRFDWIPSAYQNNMGKNIIITGASGNLGKATVEKLVGEGHKIIVTVSPGKSLGFYEGHPQVEVHNLDLTNEADVSSFVSNAIQRNKTIDAALLLVGGYASGNIKDTSGESIRKMYSLNFETAYFIAQPIFNQMMQQKKGKIILIGARPALRPKDGKNSLAYALSKSLIFELAKILNVEGSDSHVTTTVIVPSTIDTPANRKGMPNADFNMWVKPEEIASTISFVLSEEASSLRESILKVYGRA